MHIGRSFPFAALLALALGLITTTGRLAGGQGIPIAWIELGPDGNAIARLLTPETACPTIDFSTGTVAMQARGSPADDYPLLVCEAAVPPDATTAAVDGIMLHTPPLQPSRIVILGDTGCRLKGEESHEAVQACNDVKAWPAAAIASSAAAWNPDLVIDVGDYLYREAPCPPGNAGCAGSPSGYNWASWNADFFTPEASLLPAAPWVFVRGDHELCERAGEGWFRFLDPRPLASGCQDYTDPYLVRYGDLRLLMLDSANADDYVPVPDEVSTYKGQFDLLSSLATPGSWLLTHRPVWVFGHDGEKDGVEQLFRDNPTLQAAAPNGLPDGIDVVISGHIHLFESLAFSAMRPSQLVVGNGGTALDPNIQTPLTGLTIDGATVMGGSVVDKFGYMTLERSNGAWAGTLRDVDGNPLLVCAITPDSLQCAPPNG
jgi:Calcineurin-like phosphoesterase